MLSPADCIMLTYQHALGIRHSGAIQQQGKVDDGLGLDQPATMMDAVRRLGQRHGHDGVQAHHYATVGDALLWTLAQQLGPAFTDGRVGRRLSITSERYARGNRARCIAYIDVAGNCLWAE